MLIALPARQSPHLLCLTSPHPSLSGTPCSENPTCICTSTRPAATQHGDPTPGSALHQLGALSQLTLDSAPQFLHLVSGANTSTPLTELWGGPRKAAEGSSGGPSGHRDGGGGRRSGRCGWVTVSCWGSPPPPTSLPMCSLSPPRPRIPSGFARVYDPVTGQRDTSKKNHFLSEVVNFTLDLPKGDHPSVENIKSNETIRNLKKSLLECHPKGSDMDCPVTESKQKVGSHPQTCLT